MISTGTLDPARVREIGQKISDLEKQGAKRFLLDLRHCSTGAPEDGVALANLFLDKGLIAYSQGQKISRQDFQAVASKAITKLPLVVLTNRATAEAAEVAAAALLESKRAEVVGERTFGDAAAPQRHQVGRRQRRDPFGGQVLWSGRESDPGSGRDALDPATGDGGRAGSRRRYRSRRSGCGSSAGQGRSRPDSPEGF